MPRLFGQPRAIVADVLHQFSSGHKNSVYEGVAAHSDHLVNGDATALDKEFTTISQELGELAALRLIYQDRPRGPYQFSIPGFSAYLRELAKSGD